MLDLIVVICWFAGSLPAKTMAGGRVSFPPTIEVHFRKTGCTLPEKRATATAGCMSSVRFPARLGVFERRPISLAHDFTKKSP